MGNSVKSESVNFTDLLKEITSNKILLPDFQRGFKWDVSKQKALICSVISRFPLGTLLILRGNKGDFGSKTIGSTKDYTIIDKEEEKVSFLLDGQQRLTVLANVFSPIILEKGDFYSKLKKVFFLKIPTWRETYEDHINNKHQNKVNDVFSLFNLSFPRKYIDDFPQFTTESIIEDIVSEDYSKEEFSIESLYTKWDDGGFHHFTYLCESNTKKYYYIPLFFLSQVSKTNPNKLKTLIDKFSEKLNEEIATEIDTFIEKNKDDEQIIENLIKNLYSGIDQKDDAQKIKKAITDADKSQKQQLIDRVAQWTKSFINEYLCDSCVKSMVINKIELDEEQGDRATSIFTNMNQTSVTLDEFDLLVARVAKCMKGNNYVEYIKECFVGKGINFNIEEVLKDKQEMIKLLKNNIQDYIKEIASLFGVFDEKDKELNPTIKQTILKLLYLYNKKRDFNYSEMTNEFGSTQKARTLTPEKIKESTEKVCEAITKALLFFLCRCGIRKIEDINYKQHLYLVSAIFLNDKWYNDNEVHKKLELWYWTSIFSGIYNSDQKEHILEDISNIYKMLESKKDNNKDYYKTYQWLVNRGNDCFRSDTSNMEVLLMNKKDNPPKENYRKFVCQFYLSQGYQKFYSKKDENGHYIDPYIDIFTKELEAHHLIPLATANDFGDSEKNLRGDKTHYLNSPLNFVYITKAENDFISNKPYEAYISEISLSTKKDIGIYCSDDDIQKQSEDRDKKIFKERLKDIQGKIASKFLNIFKVKLDEYPFTQKDIQK